jgi:hypothetical protein
MLDLIRKLHAILNVLKGFSSGYTTKKKNAMIVSYEGKVYRIDITEVGEGKLSSDHIKLLEEEI